MMKKCCTDNVAPSPDNDSLVTLRRQSRNNSTDIDFTGLEDAYQDSDDDINAIKAAVEKILEDVKADCYEPLPLGAEVLQNFEEPLLRLRAFMENNDSINTSSMAVNGPCKHPVQALRTFLDR